MSKSSFGLIVLFVVMSVFSAGCQAEQVEPTELAFKGLELYSWTDEAGVWKYSILYGTNRNKTLAEIQAVPLTLQEVKNQFCALPKGEQVFWVPGVWDDAGEMKPFPDVPSEIVTELREQAENCGIELHK